MQEEKIISVSKSKSLLIIDMAMGYAIILVFKHFLNIFLSIKVLYRVLLDETGDVPCTHGTSYVGLKVCVRYKVGEKICIIWSESE